MSIQPCERTTMIFRMERRERFQAVRSYLRRDVIVTARPSRTIPTPEAGNYRGRVEAVAWGLLGDADVAVLVLAGPQGQGMPVAAIELSKIVDIRECEAA